MIEARRRHPEVRFHLSTLGDAANHAAAAFWRRLGVERITLPRHLALAEIEAVVEASPGMRFDAFVLYGQCPNAEGHCTFSHDHPRRVWPCVQRWRVEPGDASDEARRAADAQAGWGGLVRADACGLCALWDLAHIGVDAVKIVGRGAPTERKRWAVAAVRDLLALVESGIGREEFRADARARSNARLAHACNPRLCYFPECVPREAPPSPGPLPLEGGAQGGGERRPLSPSRGEGWVGVSTEIERAVFVPDLDRLPAGEAFDRLYLGSEFCRWRLPSPAQLGAALEAAASRGAALSLVTPFLDEAGLAQAVALVRALPEDGRAEVVANDPGLLEAVLTLGWRGALVAGRLMTKQRRGPGVQDPVDATPEALAALAGSALDSAPLVAWLGEVYGVRRFEIDDIAQGPAVPPLPDGVRLSLYRPWVLVTATRNCPWIFDGRRSDRTAGCARPCRGRRLDLLPDDASRSLTRPLVLGGCAQFLRVDRADRPLPPGVDRVVWQPDIPA
jgi:collagenase-like PrtC family protease